MRGNKMNLAKAAVTEFFKLAHIAARNGGFWVSAAGGTANVIAGQISRNTGVSYEDAHQLLDAIGGEDWYSDLAFSQPWGVYSIPEEGEARWDARLIARVACRRAQRAVEPVEPSVP